MKTFALRVSHKQEWIYNMEIILILVFFILLVFFYKSQKNLKIRNSIDKKQEIIKNYEKELKTLLQKYKHDKTKQVEERKKFLQYCNSELSRNIFFTNDETVKIIENLLKI